MIYFLICAIFLTLYYISQYVLYFARRVIKPIYTTDLLELDEIE